MTCRLSILLFINFVVYQFCCLAILLLSNFVVYQFVLLITVWLQKEMSCTRDAFIGIARCFVYGSKRSILFMQLYKRAEKSHEEMGTEARLHGNVLFSKRKLLFADAPFVYTKTLKTQALSFSF